MIEFEKSFASFLGKTKNGKLKIHCWHQSKNKDTTPRTVSKTSNKKYWFICDNCPHDFHIDPSHISKRNQWCSYCCIPSRKLCFDKTCNFCYKKSFASYTGKTKNGKLKIHCWHQSKNKDTTPRTISMTANKKYWFICDICNHEFDSCIGNVVNLNRWCPYCSNSKLCNNKECKICFDKSFASCKNKTPSGNLKLDFYHKEKNEKKGVIISPRQVFKTSGRKYWFKCDKCHHNFNSEMNSIVKIDTWCPYCCIPTQKVCGDKKCKMCFDKVFASYKEKTKNGKLKIDCLHPIKNGKINIIEILKQSTKKLWFKCDICNHDFNNRVEHVTRGTWCPYCAHKQHCTDDNCTFCYKKSFQYILDTKPDIEERMTIIFSKNITARSLPAHRDHKVTVICKKCNNKKYMAISGIAQGNGCSTCTNKTEKKLLLWFQKHKKTIKIKSIQAQYNPLWCGTKYIYFHKKHKEIKYVYKRFPFDFLIEFYNNKKVIIELDGRQHYEDDEYLQKRRTKRKKACYRSLPSSLHQQIRDRYKEMQAKKHKLSVIRVKQEDVWKNKNDWQEILMRKIK